MRNYASPLPAAIAALLAATAGLGCGDSDARAQDALAAARANEVAGRVTTADGKPITGAQVRLDLGGFTEGGQRASLRPTVAADGTYRQAVPAGLYRFGRCRVAVTYKGDELLFDLEPKGDGYATDRDSKAGITQDFVWRLTGPHYYQAGAKLDPLTETHWYGMSVGMAGARKRDDTGKAAAMPPAGATLVFTLTPAPNARALDGSALKAVTFERAFDADRPTLDVDLNDISPGDYTLAGVARTADGRSLPLVVQGPNDQPKFVDVGRVVLQTDALSGSMWKPNFSWALKE